jgi:Predicted membrane protein
MVTLGFLISYPFKHTFIGALLTALFGASMIGGIADWFGITALFRKPLGIPFKTEIIPRSKEKIYESLVYMVENELLTKEALKSKLEKFNISEKLIYYLREQGGKNDLSVLANRIVSDILDRVDPEQAGTYLEKLINDNSSSLDLYALFQSAAEWMSRNAADERLIPKAIEEVKDFILFPGFGDLINRTLGDIFAKIEENAEKETTGKRLFFKLVLTIADFSDISPSKLSNRLLTEALEYFNRLKDPQSVQRKGFENWIDRTVQEFKTNPALQESVKEKGMELLKGATMSTAFANYVYPYFRGNEQFTKLKIYIDKFIDKLVENFINSPDEQSSLDTFVKNALVQLIDENHAVIGQLVKSRLNAFSTEMLVEMIEDKAGNDLQIIRINGSVVGGLTGLAIFLLTFWIK